MITSKYQNYHTKLLLRQVPYTPLQRRHTRALFYIMCISREQTKKHTHIFVLHKYDIFTHTHIPLAQPARKRRPGDPLMEHNARKKWPKLKYTRHILARNPFLRIYART